MRSLTLSLAIVAATVVFAAEVNAQSVLIQVAPARFFVSRFNLLQEGPKTAAKAEAKDPEDFRWLLDPATNRDGLDPFYKAMLEKLKKSKVPSGDKAKDVAFGHTGPLDARETWKVAGLLRIGINIPGFADRGDLIWVVRFEMISWGVTQEMWINSTTGAIRTMLPMQRKRN